MTRTQDHERWYTVNTGRGIDGPTIFRQWRVSPHFSPTIPIMNRADNKHTKKGASPPPSHRLSREPTPILLESRRGAFLDRREARPPCLQRRRPSQQTPSPTADDDISPTNSSSSALLHRPLRQPIRHLSRLEVSPQVLPKEKPSKRFTHPPISNPLTMIFAPQSTARAATNGIPHACHQKFASLERAQASREVWRETADAVGYKPSSSSSSGKSGDGLRFAGSSRNGREDFQGVGEGNGFLY
jgi:hypothetical protein